MDPQYFLSCFAYHLYCWPHIIVTCGCYYLSYTKFLRDWDMILYWVDILLAMADSKLLSLDICALCAGEVYYISKQASLSTKPQPL